MTAFLPPFDLHHFLDRISQNLNLAGTVTINRQSESSKLDAVPSQDLKSAAAEHGLRVVRRMGGAIFQFTRLPLFHFPYQTLEYPR